MQKTLKVREIAGCTWAPAMNSQKPTPNQSTTVRPAKTPGTAADDRALVRLSPAPKSATKSVKQWACLLTKLPPFSGSGQVLRHNTGLTVQRPWAAFWRKPGTCER
jgi:hypothetical protein